MHYANLGELPILIKLIDAKKDLSVQVHPDDEYAFEHENGQRGKTEMWYVLDASRNAQLVYGFSHDIEKVFWQKLAGWYSRKIFAKDTGTSR